MHSSYIFVLLCLFASLLFDRFSLSVNLSTAISTVSLENISIPLQVQSLQCVSKGQRAHTVPHPDSHADNQRVRFCVCA